MSIVARRILSVVASAATVAAVMAVAPPSAGAGESASTGTASISGTVTDSQGQPLANVDVLVTASGTSGSTVAPYSAATGSTGTFELTSLPAGDYQVCFEAVRAAASDNTGYVSRCLGQAEGAWWDGSFPQPANLQTVTLADGGTGTADIALAAGGVVTGTVTAASDSHGVVGVQPEIHDPASYGNLDAAVAVTPTGSDGNYTIKGVPTGVPVTVCFNTAGISDVTGGYVPQCYNGKPWGGSSPVPSDATPVTVATDQPSTSVNAVLAHGGAIAGTVTAADGTTGLDEVGVFVFDADGFMFGPVDTNSSGAFATSGLPAGNYSVCFDVTRLADASTLGYVDTCYGGVEWTGFSTNTPPTGANPVSVTDGAMTDHIDFAFPEAAPTTDAPVVTTQPADVTVAAGSTATFTAAASGNPTPTVQWQQSSDGGTTWTGVNDVTATSTTLSVPSTSTGMDGNQYRAEFTNSAGVATSDPATLIVTAATSGGEITGTVTDSDGHGLAGAWVGVFNATTFDPFAATTASDGTYAITGLVTDSYTVCVNPREATGGSSTTGYVTKCYGQASDAWWAEEYPIPDDAQAVSVSDASSPIADISLPTAGAISGTVSAAVDGHRIVGVTPNVYLQGAGRYLDGVSFAQTGVDGSYTVKGVPTDVAVVVCFDTSAVSDDISPTGYSPECFDGKPWLAKVGTSIPIDATAEIVTAGGTINDVNGSLPIGGAIRGEVVNSDGNGLTGVGVTAVDSEGSVFEPGVSDSNGQYELLGLPTGQYVVCYSGVNAFVNSWSGQTLYANQCYDGVPWLGPDLVPAGAETVAVSAGQSTQMPTVTLAGIGGPATVAPYVTVQPVGAFVTAPQTATFTAAAGGVPTPTVQWQMSTDGGSTWSDVPGSTSTTLTVSDTTTAMSGDQYHAVFMNSAGTVTTDPAALTVAAASEPGEITGTVTDSDGSGIAGVNISIFNDLGDVNFTAATTGSDGTYAVNGLAPAEYTVCFDARGAAGGSSSTGYVSKCYGQPVGAWWDGSYPAPADAQTVSVSDAAGQDLNISLVTGGAISGTVTAQSDSGHGIQNVRPELYKPDGTFFAYVRASFTDADGRYTVTGIPAGEQFVVCFGTLRALDSVSLTGYVPQCNGGVTWLSKSGVLDFVPAGAQTMSVVAGHESSGVDASLATGGDVSGTITDPDGHPLRSAGVIVVDADGYSFGFYLSDAEGHFVASGLPEGDYSVCIDGSAAKIDGTSGGPNYADQCYDGVPWTPSYSGDDLPPSGTTAVRVEVSADQQLGTTVLQLAGGGEPSTTAPTVTVEPANTSVTAGQAATFTAVASGVPTPTVQWQVSTDRTTWADVPGATSTTMTITGTTTTMSGGQYRAVFSNSAGRATTAPATLTVSAAGGGDTGGSTDGGADQPAAPATSPTTTVSTTVTAGGTASSSPDAQPTADDPVIASVQSPVAGTITFTPVDSASAQTGYTMLGQSFVISAPMATTQKPLQLSFAVDTGALPSGMTLADLTVFRDGVPVPVCTGANGVADPDPCVTSVTTASGIASVKVLSSHASTWTFGVKSEAVDSRIAGSNRYETAAQIATEFGTANAVVLANGTDAKSGADALAANYLAGRVGAPILLVQAGRVESQVLTAVKSVLKGAADPTVYVMDGIDAVSGAVVSDVQKAAKSVAAGTVKIVRVAGADRYETSAVAAAKAGTVANSIRFSSSATAQRTAILASGEVNADALAAGALSNAWKIPVLLTGSGALPASVVAAIKDLKITQLIVLGGTDRVSAGALGQAKAAGAVSVKRIAGANRFATAAALYGFVFDTAVNADGEHYGAGASGGATVYLANGVTGFPDALSVGPLAGKSNAALLTTGSSALASPAAKFLSGHAAALTTAIALGKASTLAAAVLAAAQKAIG
jgi:putative cell wall-binding protein